MIAGLLFKQIVELFLIIFVGFLLVKINLLKESDSKVLSTITLYAICPCVIIGSFQIECTPEVQKGLILSFVAAIVLHIVMIAFSHLLGKIFHLNNIELASIIYTNSGNIIMPIVIAIFGKEWVVYTTPFIVVQTLVIWTHGRMLICEQKKFDVMAIVKNINVIASAIGILFFVFNIQLPTLITETMDQMTNMVGPLSMLVAGMLIAGIDAKKYLKSKKFYLTLFLKMIVLPMLCLITLMLIDFESMVENGSTIFLITLFAASAPCAASITQIAQVYDKDSEYASAYYFVTTLLCIITMPIFAWLFQTI